MSHREGGGGGAAFVGGTVKVEEAPPRTDPQNARCVLVERRDQVAREPARRRKRGEGVAVELDEPSPQEGEPEAPAFALNDVLHLRLGQSVLQQLRLEGPALCIRGGRCTQAHPQKQARGEESALNRDGARPCPREEERHSAVGHRTAENEAGAVYLLLQIASKSTPSTGEFRKDGEGRGRRRQSGEDKRHPAHCADHGERKIEACYVKASHDDFGLVTQALDD